MSADVTLSDATPAASTALEDGAAQFVEALAVQIRDGFRSNVKVATGALQASASVITATHSDYAANVAAAAALAPHAAFAPAWTPDGPLEAAVQLPIDHAGINEFGSARQPAHPALIPAVEMACSQIDSIAREVFSE